MVSLISHLLPLYLLPDLLPPVTLRWGQQMASRTSLYLRTRPQTLPGLEGGMEPQSRLSTTPQTIREFLMA